MPRFTVVARPIVCRPPYLPIQARSLTDEQQRCVWAQWHTARPRLDDNDAAPVRALAWVGTDTRDKPHVLELIARAGVVTRRVAIVAEPTAVTSADIAREWRA